MELILGMSCKSSKFELKDFISSMPDNVISNILDRLPLQDAVRTGILARNWRFKWTLLSQLVFDEEFFEYLREKKCERSYGRIISRLLLHLKGGITKFYIYIEKQRCSVLDEEDINHWMLFLSGKGIQDLTFVKKNGPPFKLLTHLFSCLELKHLKLVNCCFDSPASFHGFPSLLSLHLHNVQLESGKYGVSSILEHLGCLPKVQELELDFISCKLIEDGAIKRFPITFPCVKTLKLSKVYLGAGMNLSRAFKIIKSFPNLQNLEIRADNLDTVPTPPICFPEVDYRTMGLLQLRNVVLTWFTISDNEVCFVKYLLACSPFLKKISIYLHWFLESDYDVFARQLLEFHRASPVVEIDIA